MLENYLQNLCSPAKLYLAISAFILFFLVAQNMGSKNHKFCVGDHDTCFNATPLNILLFFVIKILYVGFWSYLLNYACRTGNSSISWILVLFPVILFFVLLTSMTIGPAFIYP